jgi:predicted nucleic acid-binding protein
MSAANQQKVFFDTNLWIYLYSGNEPIKEVKIRQLVTQRFSDIVISSQVLGEMYNVLTRKKLKPEDETQLIIQEQAKNFETVSITKETVLKALEIINKYKFPIGTA